MKKIAYILTIILLTACGNSTKQNNVEGELLDSVIVEFADECQKLNYLQIIGDFVEIPWFEIVVELSEKAEEKLKTNNESIIVNAEFIHNPVKSDSTRALYADELLLSHRIELTDERVARFENLRFPQRLYDLLENKDIILSINVWSGRRSSLYNILHCVGLEEPMSKIKGRRIVVKCKLIRDDD